MRRSSGSSPAGLWILAVLASGFPAMGGLSRGAAQGPDSDCNANGVPDSREVAASDLSFSGSAYHVFPALDAVDLEVADIDGDLLPDVVLAGQRSRSIHILLGTAAGALAGEVSIPVAGEPEAVEVIDIDHDGDQDVAVILQPTSRLALLANDGDGNLANAAETATGAGPHSMAAADFDGDGWTDLAVGASNQFGIFPGRQGGFGDPVTYPRPSIIAVAAGSIDADSLPDLAAGLAGSDAAVYLSRAGALEPVGIARTAGWPRYLEVADLDGDGSGDLAAGSLVQTQASVTRGRGDGTFEEPRILDVPEGMVPLAGADLDFDGTPDLLLASGGFLQVRSARNDTWELESSFLAPRAVALEIADLDVDGFLDALILSRTQLFIHRGLPGREFLAVPVVPTLPRSGGLAAADFDGDGEVDLVVGSDEAFGQISFHPGLGDGSFGPSIVGPSSHGPFVLQPVDFSGDGAPDIAVLGWGGNLGTLENVGGGSFRLAGNAYSNGIRSETLAVLDMDADGRLDMIVPDIDAMTVSIYPIETDGALGSPVLVPTVDVVEPRYLRAGDITADGLPDIVVATPEGRFGAHHGRGRAGLGPVRPAIETDRLAGFELADLDADGFPDIAACQIGAPFLVFRGRGDGTFAPGNPTLEFAARELHVIDLNGDGKVDLASAGGEEVWVSVGIGGGEFLETRRFFAGVEARRMAIADFDRDGALDAAALWTNDHASGITVLLNETEPPASPDCDGNGVPDDCDIRDGSRPDVDGNGIPDMCDPDCDGDGAPDALEIASGGAADVDTDGVPDPCERDCNANGAPDDHEIASGVATDVDRNLVPDECQSDCNANELPDRFEVDAGLQLDLNANGLPDDCDPDCNRNTVPDDEDLRRHDSRDANGNEIPDECDIESGTSEDRNGNGVPDEAEVDCDESGVPDVIEILGGVAADRNRNLRIDACDIRDGLSLDVDLDGVPDEVQPDCDGNGVPDGHEIATGAASDCDADGRPDGCDISPGRFDLGFPETLPALLESNPVAVADLDADGLEDIIVLDSPPHGVAVLSVYLHRGTAGFHGLPAVNLTDSYGDLIPADLDRDGRIDLTGRPRNSNRVNVFRGNGDGTFAAPVIIETHGNNTSSLVAADITCDGKLDILATNLSFPELSLLEGRGDGTFEPAILLDLEISPSSPVAADMDRDGKVDLFIVSWDSARSFAVLPGDCAGPFREPVPGSSLARLGPLAIEDQNGDGIPDLVALTDLGISRFRGAGDGSFVELEPLSWDRDSQTLEVVDLDGDARPDIVTTSDSLGHVSISMGLGDFAFSPRREFFAGQDVRRAAFLDADLDGDRDIVAASLEGIVILTQEDGALDAPVYVATGGSPIGLHDMDRDGFLDLLVAMEDERAIDVFSGDDALGFGEARRVSTPGWPLGGAAADLDLDGFEDLAAVDYLTRAIEILMGDADGGYRYARTIPSPDSDLGEVRFADFNEDGFPDLLFLTFSMTVFLARGDGSFGPPDPIPIDHYRPRGLPIVDMDGDGHLDIVLATESQDPPTILLGDGTGAFPRSRRFQLGRELPSAVITADLDGDAVLDIAAAFRQAPGVISVIRGRGNALFGAPKLLPVNSGGAISLIAADLDRDGAMDLVTFNPGSRPGQDGLSLLGGLGNGDFENAVHVPAPAPPGRLQPLYAVDLSRSGRTDIVLPIESSRGVLLYRNRTRPADDPDCDGNGLPDSCDLAAGPSADCDGNGVLDRCEDPPEEGPCAPAGCRVPGDCSEDGRLDMTDGLCVLGYIFLGSPAALPCDLGSPADPSNLELLDWQPDGVVDISDAIALFSYLHLGAPPHVRAVPGSETTACVPVEGCSGL